MLYQENDWVYVISEDSKEGFIPYRLVLLSPSDDHRLIIMIICNLYFPFPFLIIFPISSYCAQFGSQLAGLALNVKKKMPRGEVTVKTI